MLLFPSLNCFPTWVITSQLINSSSRRCLRWSGLTKATAKSPTFSIIHANGCSMFWPIIHQNRVLLSLWEIVDRGVKQHGKRTSLSFRKHVRKHTLYIFSTLRKSSLQDLKTDSLIHLGYTVDLPAIVFSILNLALFAEELEVVVGEWWSTYIDIGHSVAVQF